MAGNNRYLYDKMVRDGTITPIINTDYHPSYPVENIRNIWTDYWYRSKYGLNSGWGYFKITTSNQKLYFKDNGAVARTATITVGDYDANSLIAEIETQMEAQTSDTFTVSYSSTSRKFTIVDDTGTYELTCTSTTNAIWDTIGYATAANRTGGASYQGDYVRIHTGCAVQVLSAGSTSISLKCAVVFGLNVTSAYTTMEFQKDTGGGTWVKVSDFTYSVTTGVAITMFASQSGSKYRIYIVDRENPLGYVQVGTCLFGDYYEISKWFQYGFSEDIDDTSKHQYSKQGYINVITGYFLDTKGVTYELMAADEGYLVAMYRDVGKRYPFVFVQDSTDAINTFQYCMFTAKLSRRGKDAYTKEITLAWVGVK